MTSQLSPLTQAFTGAVGSASANALAYPLDLVTTRLQTTRSPKLQGPRGILAVLRHTADKYGFGALYDGLGSDTASTIISNFLYFYAYTLLRALVLRRASRASSSKPASPPALSMAQELLLGFVAGVSSKMIASPLSVVTVRLQTAREDDEELPGSTVKDVAATIQSIYKDEGLRGFWKGYESTILLSMNPSIAFACLQFIRRLLHFRHRSSATATQVLPSGSLESFITAALANTAAVTLLYPLILAKTRLQVARKTAPSPPGPSDTTSHLNASQASSSPSAKVVRFSIPEPTMMSTLQDAYTGEDGYPDGLYQGLSAQVAKGVISMGVTIMVKERIEQGLVRAVRRWRQ
ncbi:mitochondrial carrier [Peniophora sp. CONT]|nr:mitochondrial carrier [Peniophora sp. CONT]